jgi:hypothetical protein
MAPSILRKIVFPVRSKASTMSGRSDATTLGEDIGCILRSWRRLSGANGERVRDERSKGMKLLA